MNIDKEIKEYVEACFRLFGESPKNPEDMCKYLKTIEFIKNSEEFSTEFEMAVMDGMHFYLKNLNK